MSNQYIAQVFADYVNVREGRKPLLIVSYGKSSFAGTSLTQLAFEDGLTVHHEDFVCEDGKLHRHAFICQAGAPYAREARDAIVDCISESCLTRDATQKRKLRLALQAHLGHLLGYSAYEIVEFQNSVIGRSCPCDCCGSEYTAETPAAPRKDASPRFIPNAYTY